MIYCSFFYSQNVFSIGCFAGFTDSIEIMSPSEYRFRRYKYIDGKQTLYRYQNCQVHSSIKLTWTFSRINFPRASAALRRIGLWAAPTSHTLWLPPTRLIFRAANACLSSLWYSPSLAVRFNSTWLTASVVHVWRWKVHHVSLGPRTISSFAIPNLQRAAVTLDANGRHRRLKLTTSLSVAVNDCIALQCNPGWSRHSYWWTRV